MWILSEYIGENYAVINLNYVSRIYMEYDKKENGKSNRLLADYKGETICLGEYKTKEELQEKVRQLGSEMARTDMGISLNIRENTVKLEPINIDLEPINIDLKKIFNDLTPEKKMFIIQSLLPLITNEEDLTSLIEIIESQISKLGSERNNI